MSDKRGYHDIGGQPAGPVDPSHHEELPWQKLMVALSNVLGTRGRGLVSVHEGRRAREELGADVYNRLAYFERSAQVTANLLVEKGLLTHEEIDARIAELREKAGEG